MVIAPAQDMQGLLQHGDFQRCCGRLARDLVAVYLTTVLTMTARELSELNQKTARDSDYSGYILHDRDVLVKELLLQDTLALKCILICFCPEELHLRRMQTVNAVRELLSCSRDDFQLFVQVPKHPHFSIGWPISYSCTPALQTAAMNNPDIFGVQFLQLIVDLRTDWTGDHPAAFATQMHSAS